MAITETSPKARARKTKFNIAEAVSRLLAAEEIDDFHTHLYNLKMVDRHGKPLLLTLLEDLLTYHYLVCEVLRVIDLPLVEWEKLSKREKAKLIWQSLFRDRSPLSEATLGVMTALKALKIDTNVDYDELEAAYTRATKGDLVTKVLKLAGIRSVFMTNDPLDPDEQANWTTAPVEPDPRFRTVFRLDSAIGGRFSDNVAKLNALGYSVSANLTDPTKAELRRYLSDWTEKLKPSYLAISLPPDFSYPTSGNGNVTAILRDVVLPFARERGLPVALMIGVRRGVNPALGQAGDGYGRSDIRSIEEIARANPDVTFYVTLLHRDDQHPLVVAARKFRNIIPFGNWWFVNIAETVEEITAMRLQGLGLSFIPWHSDCRHLLHLLYKKAHFLRILGKLLTQQYEKLAEAGGTVDEATIERDVKLLMNFRMPA